MSETSELAAIPLQEDIPCTGCGYDLRGLSAGGVCPECGIAIGPSLSRWEVRQQIPLQASDPRWLRRVREGLLVAVVTFVLMVSLACAPHWAFKWKSPQRRWMLEIACTAYVLSCFSAWRLATPDAGEFCRRDPFRRILRASAAVCLAEPFLVALLPKDMPVLVVIAIVVPILVLGCAAASSWFIYLGRLATAGRARSIAIEAIPLAVASLLFYLAMLLPELDAPEDSLSGLFRTYLLPFGSIEAMYQVRLDIENGHFPQWITALVTAVPLWSLVVAVRMIFRLRHLSRRMVGVAVARK